MRAWPVLLLIPALSGCLGFWTGAEDAPAPAFIATDIDGVAHNLSQPGHIVLLDFMGTWCGPCQRGVPDLKALQADHNITLLSISSTDSVGQMMDFRARYGVTWPMIVDRQGIVDAYLDAAGHSRMIWPSYALVVDEKIVFFNRGETLPSTLAVAIVDAGGSSKPVDGDVALPALYGAFLGAATAASPFMWRRTASRQIPAPAVVAVLATFTAFAFLATYGGVPLTGRVLNVAGLSGLVGLAALGLAKARGIDRMQVQSRALDDERTWRRSLSWLGNWAYVGLPLWSGALLIAMRQTAVQATLLIMLAYAIGLGAGAEGLRRRGAPWRVVWVGAAGLALAGGVAFVQWIR